MYYNLRSPPLWTMYQLENRLFLSASGGFNRSKNHFPLYIKHVLANLEVFKVAFIFKMTKFEPNFWGEGDMLNYHFFIFFTPSLISCHQMSADQQYSLARPS